MSNPELNDGWGLPLTDKEWEAYNKQQKEFLDYYRDYQAIYSSIDKEDRSQTLQKLFHTGLRAIETSQELLNHMSYVRVQREKPRRDGANSTRQNKLKWEEFIIEAVKQYCDKNTRIEHTELEHYVEGLMIAAQREGTIKNNRGNAIKAPLKTVKTKIKNACKTLDILDPYPTRSK